MHKQQFDSRLPGQWGAAVAQGGQQARISSTRRQCKQQQHKDMSQSQPHLGSPATSHNNALPASVPVLVHMVGQAPRHKSVSAASGAHLVTEGMGECTTATTTLLQLC